MNTQSERLVNNLAALQEQKAQIEEQIEVVKGLLLERLRETTTVGDRKVIISRPQRIAYDQIAKDYPADQYPRLYEQKISTAAVKDAFSPEALTHYQAEGKPQVRLA